mmetsp:Transcript_47677/g.102085  ORF Transcript_47677/g.102085 Transcript_47677/m.102085 type:complete len:530 (-) Transcript_47677:124-1713(-)
MTRLLGVVVACACLSNAVAFGETCDHTNLALLQTIIQVDDASVEAPVAVVTVTKSSAEAASLWSNSSREKPMWHQIITKVLIGVALATLIGSMFYFQRLVYTKRDAEAPAAQPKKRMSWTSWLLGIALAMLSCCCTDQYVPQMPEMAKFFDCTHVEMEVSLQMNWVLKAVCALVFGPLSDRVGRKPILILCSSMMCLSCFACAGSNNIYWFYAARAVQAVGEGGPSVVQSTYRDVYDDMKDIVRAGQAYTIVNLIAPISAPAIGGIIAQQTGLWQCSFLLFGAIGGLLALGFAYYFDETLPPKNEDEVSSYFQDLGYVLGDFHLIVILCVNLLIMAQPMLYTSSNSFIFELDYHKSPLFVAGMSATSLVVGGIAVGLTRLLFSDWPPVNTIRLCIASLAVFAITMLALVGSGVMDNIWTVIVTMWGGCFLGVPVVVCIGPLYMAQMKSRSGMAASMMAATSGVCGALLCHASTWVIVPNGAKGLAYVSLSSGLFTSVFFFVCFGFYPPAWAFGKPASDSKLEKLEALES